MSFLLNCLRRLSCIEIDIFGNMNVDHIFFDKINDNFIKPTILKDGDKIEFKGEIEGICKYYLFEHSNKKYYIKKSLNKYGICESIDKLNDKIMLTGIISKIPSQDKLKKSYENINHNKNIYVLEDGLKISHINSTFTKLDELGKQKVATFEYLLSSDDGIIVLSYNYVHGLSLVNVNLL